MNTKEYLKHAVQIEMLLYEQKRVIADLKNTINNLKNYYYGGKESKTTIIDGQNIWTAVACLFGGAVLGCVGGLFASLLFPPKLTPTFDVWVQRREQKLGLIRYLKTGTLVGVLLVLCVVIIYIWVAVRDNREVEKNNKIVENNNQQLYTINMEKIQKLSLDLDIAQKNLTDTKNIQNRFYAANIIHEKYRNLVAVCSFYEYFDTGRCNSLTGHGGAYDVYEYEIRLNRIIDRLDVVIEKLDQIRYTQHELYNAVSACNRNISRLNGQLNRFSDTINQIADNSAVTAFNSRITAENTTHMKWMMYMKM